MKKIFILLLPAWLGLVVHAQSPCLKSPALTSVPAFSVIPNYVAAADFDEDGKSDLVLSGSFSLPVFLSSGPGGFLNYTSTSLSNNALSIVPVDFNSDGHMDIASCCGIFLGSGTGTFSAPYGFAPVTNGSGLVAADFNGDGYPDLAISESSGNSVSILLGSATGTVAGYGSYYVSGGANELTSGDFNGDGIRDLAVSSTGANSITFLIGMGTGLFSAGASYTVGNSPLSMAAADANGDGYLDLAVTNTGSRSVSLLLGSSTGTFSAGTDVPVENSPTGIISKDFNGDGNADFAVANSASSITSVLLGNGAGGFFKVNYVSGTGVRDVASGDFNGDGIPDLSSGSYGAGYPAVMLNQGNGSFSSALSIGLRYNSNSYAVTSGRFNSDAQLDFAVVNTGKDSISTLLSPGPGTLYSLTDYSVGTTPIALTSADFNSDGFPDLAVANRGSANVSVLMGSASGLFSAAVNYSAGSQPTSVISSDFNADGKPDLALANNISNNVSVLLGTGTGSFNPASYFSVGSNPTSLAAADMNNDGIKDIITANYGSNQISILKGLGGGSFAPATNFGVGTNPVSIISADFNLDGKADVAVAHAGSLNIYVLIGNGAAGFTLSTTYANGASYLDCITSADFNGDGKPDIVSGNGFSNTISVLLGTGTAGVFGAPSIYASGYHTTSVITPDYNADGLPDIVALNNSQGNLSVFVRGIAPVVSISSASTACAGSSVTLTASGASLYNWNNAGAGPGITVTPTITSTYSVTGYAVTGCMATAAKTITVHPTPTVSVNNGSICSGQVFTINPAGASTYTYSSGSQTVSPAASTSYSVSGANGFGCVGSAVSSVTVNQLPVITVNSGSVCAGQTFTMIPAGANTYTFSNGSSTITPAANTSYTVIGTDSHGCTSNAGAVSSVTVNALPSVTAIQNSTVCAGSSSTLSAAGASTYSWTTGAATASITVTPVTSTTYTVTGTDLNNCGNTQTVSVTVDNTCADVWPGDANSDGTADNLDVLELGLHYAQTGPARASVSNAWQSYFTSGWTGTIANGKNLGHSDCNGDGAIDANDTLAIYNNYGLIHAFKVANTTTVNPQLSIVPEQTAVNTGQWGTASIYLGSSSSPVNNINGVAFTVNFDHTLIEPNSVYLEYPSSFIDAGQNLHFRKTDFNNDVIYTATTHTLSTNVSGYGKIAILHYRIKAALTQDAVLNIGVSQADQSNASGTLSPLTTGNATLMAVGATVGIDEVSEGNTAIYPNPATTALNIISSLELQKAELTDLMGRQVLNQNLSGRNGQLQLSGLANGIYFINVYSNNRIIRHEKIVVQR